MFIVKLSNEAWRSRCCFGITLFKERAVEFKTEKGAKISLARLRNFRGEGSYPDAEIARNSRGVK